MKHRIYSILALALFVLAGCVETEVWNKMDDDKNKVRLSVRTMSGVVSRAADTSLEERIDWIDVFVFNTDADQTLFHKERIDMSSAPISKTGEVSLSKNRDFFAKDASYHMYIVANASTNLSENENIKKWSDLLTLVQTDHNLQYSAFVDAEGKAAFAESPSRFLMDGLAFTSTDTPEQMQSFVINDDSKDLLLKTTLYRAAAKFVIHIKPGDKVEFQKDIVGKTPQYYINQLPISTKVLCPVAEDYYQPTTQNTPTTGLNDYTFTWNDDNSLTIIGYGYADDWSKLEYTKQTSMVFNIPMNWDKDKNAENGKEAESADNWYKIPLSKTKKFERNTYYQIDITVNAVGAEEREYALELKDIEYITQPWEEKGMNIGDYSAAFLTLNTDLVKIYDKNIDTDQLTFTSSSPIKSIKLKDVYAHDEQKGEFTIGERNEENGTYAGSDGLYAYYIDKFGQKIQLGTDPNFDLKDVDHPEWTKANILEKENILYLKEGVDKQYIRAEIWEGQERALNGNITIHSPINAVDDNEDLNWNSHFNTVRYLEFEVENEQGITATFRVEQMPLTVITNEEGFYSYRDDHKLTDDPLESPFDLFNYRDDFHSFMVTAMYLCHPHDFTEEPTTEEYLSKPQQDRDYSWGKDGESTNEGHYVWMPNHNNTCADQTPYANNGLDKNWVELRYGFYANVVKYNGGKSTGIYQGIHRPADGERPYSDYFYRERYYNLPGESNDRMNKQGAPLSPPYEVEIEIDGEKQTRIFRDHYRWSAQPVFWSKFVYKYYHEPAQGPSYTTMNGKGPNSSYRLKGQVDIYEYGPTEFGDSSWDKDWGKTWGRIDYSDNLYKFSNNRMYNISMMNTSDVFTIGYPKLDAIGNVVNNPNNSVIVSPNIMLASQLGETNHQQFLNNATRNNYVIPNAKEMFKIAERQCREYVETTFVDKNGNHMWDKGEDIVEYHDWRLPTKAEIEAIIKFQESSRAMDVVLNAQYYYCITGTGDSENVNDVFNWVSREIPGYDSVTSKGYYIRCVRDVNRK